MIALLCCTAFSANTPRFDFISIRPAGSVDPGCSVPISSPLQFSVHGCTVRGLIQNAWSVRSGEMSLPPKMEWISSAPWDINAKSSSPADPRDHWQMIQTILRERFALRFHHEKKQLPVYYLSVAKSGLKLATSRPGNGCRPFDHRSPPHPPRPTEPPYCDYVSMPFTKDGRGVEIIGTELSIQSLIKPALTMLLGRPVIDRTGLTGGYDVHLTFAQDGVPAFGLPPGAEPSGLPDLFTAIRNAGLEIVSGKAPVDVLVIDSVQKPSEN